MASSTDSKQVVSIIRFPCPEGKQDEALAVYSGEGGPQEALTGTGAVIHYHVAKPLAEPACFYTVIVWKSKAAAEEAFGSEAFAAAKAKLSSLISGKPMWFLDQSNSELVRTTGAARA